jgi:hypothetical protein
LLPVRGKDLSSAVRCNTALLFYTLARENEWFKKHKQVVYKHGRGNITMYDSDKKGEYANTTFAQILRSMAILVSSAFTG